MGKIKNITAREILDSRGNPTVEVSLSTGKNTFKSSVPSGASTGFYEAVEIRDGDQRYHGKGVSTAVENVNKIIASSLKGKKLDQEKIDYLMIELDGTENKNRLGANAILGVSMALSRAIAFSKRKPLYKEISDMSGFEIKIPQPSFNIINGGSHAGNNLDFQEFMILPEGATFKEKLRNASERYHALKKIIEKKYSSIATNIGDEGGFAPPINNPEEAIDLILETGKIDIAIDVAAGEFLKDGIYKTSFGDLTNKDLSNYYLQKIKEYPIVSIEDPFGEDSWDDWSNLMLETDNNILIIGDDLLATNKKRIIKFGERKSCNSMILKPNQIGTVTEAIEAARIARSLNWKIMVSHRSGETNDDFIADFSVGIGSDYIKSGAPARGERVAKYNRLLEIEEFLK
jgi:enolase